LPPKINLKEMQIIQSIKDRGGVIMAILIAIALISFILMDSNSGSGKGSLTAPVVGKVNGKSVNKTEFESRIKGEEDKQAQQSGQAPTGAAVMRIREQVWGQMVAENVFYEEAEKLGISLTSKELSSILLSNEQSNPFKQERGLLDANGNIDRTKAEEALKNIKKFKADQRDMVDRQILEPLKLSTAASKYSGLISASAYYPTWMQDKDVAETKSFATISYVAVPYNEISDSTIVVKDEEINAYVAKRKDIFKQEAGRTISYIAFSQLPTAADSVVAKKQVEDLKASFSTDTSAKTFVARNTSAIDYKDEYLPVSRIQSTQKDTIIKQPVGMVFGPYVEGDNYALSKIIGTRQLPDSVKARHILLSLSDRETGKEIRTDSAAKKLADSLLAAINTGANFASLALQYSSDGSKIKGGDLGTFAYGQMVAEFNQFCFNDGTTGSKKIVKTQFGYHVIEIQNQTNFKTAYKIAMVAKPIIASNETFNIATQAATKAAINKDSKSLGDYAAKNGLKMIDVPTTIKENDFSVGNMQEARSLVRWVFEANKGAVSDQITVGDDLIVATVNKIYAEGTQDATTARPTAESAIRNLKKADIIIAKLVKANTVEAAAAVYNKQVITGGADSSITMSGKIINGIGSEPKVIGASFNKDFQTKASTPIVGTSAVYVIKVNGIQPKVEPSAEQKTAQAAGRINAIRQQASNWFESLRKQADIKDQRSKFF
jgi:peptidyl-prolyl cis-trans isomerase D